MNNINQQQKEIKEKKHNKPSILPDFIVFVVQQPKFLNYKSNQINAKTTSRRSNLLEICNELICFIKHQLIKKTANSKNY